MKARITNTSKGLQGVWTADDGLQQIESGETRTLVIADNYVERAHALPFLTIVASDALDHDADGEKGGSAPEPAVEDTDTAIVALMLEGTAAEVATFIDDEKPGDAVLRAYIEQKTGRKAHPNAKTETLVQRAKEAAAA
jgi:hypothetical protein